MRERVGKGTVIKQRRSLLSKHPFLSKSVLIDKNLHL